MKKLIILTFVTLLLYSCGKPITDDISKTEYYFDDAVMMALPPLEEASYFEVLRQKECGVSEKFDTQNNTIKMVSYDCAARINGNLFFRVIMRDGKTRFYELSEYANGDEWLLSNNTF